VLQRRSGSGVQYRAERMASGPVKGRVVDGFQDVVTRNRTLAVAPRILPLWIASAHPIVCLSKERIPTVSCGWRLRTSSGRYVASRARSCLMFR